MIREYIIAAAVALLLCTCGSNKFVSPEVEMPQNYIYNSGMDTLYDMVNIRWWESFNDTTLNRLIMTALDNNRDIMTAVSTLEQARLNVKVVRASFLPDVGLEAAGDSFYNYENKTIQMYGLGATMSWEASLFGGMKNSTRAAKAEYMSSEQAAKSVMLSVASEVATTYFTLMSYIKSLEIATRSYQLRKESADLIDSIAHYGMATNVHLQQARSLVATAAADIPLYQRAIVQTSLTLNRLLGENPTAPYGIHSNPFDGYTSLPEIPIGMPSSLLERRPDIMEAYYDMMAAWAEVGIERAARYPVISLTADGGVGSQDIGDLFSGKPFIWSATLVVTQPIFNFGKYRNNLKIAKEKLYSKSAAYEQAIIVALTEVEDALASVATYKTQIERYQQLLEANQRVQQMSADLYKNGLSGYLDVIDAEQNWYSSQLQYVQIVSSQYINYVSLYKSLGGGW